MDQQLIHPCMHNCDPFCQEKENADDGIKSIILLQSARRRHHLRDQMREEGIAVMKVHTADETSGKESCFE